MENVSKLARTKSGKSIYAKMVLSLLGGFNNGLLTLRLPDGEVLEIGENPGHKAEIHILNEDFFKKAALYGDIGFGESYIDGDWTTPDLTMLLRWVIGNIENSGVLSGSKVKKVGFNILEAVNKAGHFFNRNSKTGSQSNISYHYDLSNDFYKIMLDETMSYSCGIFESENSTLLDAQTHKLKTICEDLDIQSGDHILEVGCGWGGFAEYATTHYDCKVTGITISKEQYKFAVERIEKANLQDKVTILLQDYRDLSGQFDKVVSVEMIEAVGHEYLPQYFQTIDRLLKNDGVAVIQAITSPDSRYDSFRTGVDFIQKHIFPGSLLPSVGAMVGAFQKETTLQLHNLRDIGLSYAKTLAAWRSKVEKKRPEIRELGMNDQFFSKWNYYLCYCEAAFVERNISTVQVTLIKPNNTNYK
ncbi:MAG: class I SAM-dependent methyltransferase [Bacteriovoracaceae bacterium]|nr:class I SAM-dependent methyltransferase [Bacteriovoracaceae bacterium]